MKLHNAVVGFILGDMFGVPYEFMSNPSPVSCESLTFLVL